MSIFLCIFMKDLCFILETFIWFRHDSLLEHSILHEVNFICLVKHAFWHSLRRAQNYPCLSHTEAIRERCINSLGLHIHYDLGIWSFQFYFPYCTSLSTEWNTFDWNDTFNCRFISFIGADNVPVFNDFTMFFKRKLSILCQELIIELLNTHWQNSSFTFFPFAFLGISLYNVKILINELM